MSMQQDLCRCKFLYHYFHRCIRDEFRKSSDKSYIQAGTYYYCTDNRCSIVFTSCCPRHNCYKEKLTASFFVWVKIEIMQVSSRPIPDRRLARILEAVLRLFICACVKECDIERRRYKRKEAEDDQ